MEGPNTTGEPPRATPPAPPPTPVPGPTPVPEGDATGGLIPYKNAPALTAYYLGVFSLLPCVGIPLGIAAVILGVLGLRRAARHPEVKGKVHAWVGIIVGGLFAAAYLAALVIFILASALV